MAHGQAASVGRSQARALATLTNTINSGRGVGAHNPGRIIDLADVLELIDAADERVLAPAEVGHVLRLRRVEHGVTAVLQIQDEAVEKVTRSAPEAVAAGGR